MGQTDVATDKTDKVIYEVGLSDFLKRTCRDLIGQGYECRDLIGREVLEKLSRDKQIPQENPRKEVRIRWIMKKKREKK